MNDITAKVGLFRDHQIKKVFLIDFNKNER